MVSSDFVRMMNEREHTEDYIKYVESLAKREGYILEWDKRIAYAETRCGWREEIQRDREAVRRARARGCFY
jgi:hypothetical protein